MDGSPSTTTEATLSLSRAEQWTLHHVLADCIDSQHADGAMVSMDETTASTDQATLRRAFETIDEGETTFTRAELERLQTVLARYHHRTSWWMVERPRIEGLLNCISTALEEARGETRTAE